MKILALLNVFSYVWDFNCVVGSTYFKLNSNHPSNLLTAVSNVIEKKFMNCAGTLTLLTETDANFQVMDFKNDLSAVTRIRQEFLISQEVSSKLTKFHNRRRRFVIIITDTIHSFTKIYYNIKPDLFMFNGFYVIVLVNGIISEIEEMFRILWAIQIYQVLVLFQSRNNSILAQTFKPFNFISCNDSTPITINEFSYGKFKNGDENLFPDKTRNLHNCTVRVSISENREPFMFTKLLPNGSFEMRGGDAQLIVALSNSLNFRIDFNVTDGGYFYENGTSAGPLRVLQDDKVDLSISNWWLLSHRLKFFDGTDSYQNDKIIFVIPQGRNLTTFEKLIFPFSNLVWFLILGCFLVGSFVIFVVKRHHKATQEFVLGTGVTHPYLNMFSGFIGGSQILLPKRNFARFLLMTFLMYSLVIRTLYQGAFYRLMQSNTRLKEVQTVDELIEKDFKLHMYHGDMELLKGTEAMAKRYLKS